MDTKEIAKKVLEGGNREELIKDLDETQKAQFYIDLRDAGKVAADVELEKINARRKELDRIGEKKVEVEGEAAKKVSDQIRFDQIRSEQITIARNQFKTRMGLTDEQMSNVDEAFKSEDSGRMTADLIVNDFSRAYAKANAETLIETQKKVATFERNAADFSSGSASGGSSGGGGDQGGKQYSQAAIAYAEDARKRGIKLTLDEAERGLKAGAVRHFS